MMRVAVDIDEVLVPLLLPMAKYYKKELPHNKKYPYVFKEVFDVSEEQSQKMLREFYDSREFAELLPIEHSQYALCKLKENNTLYAVTGRQQWVRTKTEQWLEQHFPGVFHDLVITNSYTPKEVSKSSVCRSLDLHVLIDDNYDTCVDCFRNNIDVINFVGDPVYPWCNDKNGISIHSWKELIIT
jgi:uncharacterized HAD superfamily protein